MKHFSKVLSLGLLLPAVFFAAPLACVSRAESAGMTLPVQPKVVAVGDSIARGYGLSDAENERYSALIAEKIRGLPYVQAVQHENLGVDGLTSEGLLARLADPDFSEKLKGADVILLSIGANDMLRHATALPDTLSRIARGEGEITLRDAVLDFLAAVGESAEPLYANLLRIFTLLKEKCPDAKLLIQTVYNPYPDEQAESFSVLSALRMAATPAVTLINDAIYRAAKAEGIPVSDVFAAFEGSTVQAPLTLFQNRFDPHPTAAGHRLIADTLWETLTDNL